jgi:SAM-dependent methyltransferase
MTDGRGDALRRPWTVGDYPVVARHLQPISTQTLAAIGIQPGDRVLDVGIGTGNAAIEAARIGARVTGLDLTPAQIDRARVRCEAEGVEVDLFVGDVQEIDLPTGSFDVVLSVMGMIFAPDHARAIAEMARVCRADGTVAITSWAQGGWSDRWRSAAASVLPPSPPGSPEPDGWGDPGELRRRFASAHLDAQISEHPFAWTFDSEETALAVLTTAAGPFVQAVEAASSVGRRTALLELLAEVIRETNSSPDGTCVLPAPYLLALARR